MLTGRDLLLFIIENGLEETEIVNEKGELNLQALGFVTILDVAKFMEVGAESVKVWIKLGYVDSVTINGYIFIINNEKLSKFLCAMKGIDYDKIEKMYSLFLASFGF